MGETLDENGKKYDLVITNKEKQVSKDYGLQCKIKKDQY